VGAVEPDAAGSAVLVDQGKVAFQRWAALLEVGFENASRN
jgi:hypothetical protein